MGKTGTKKKLVKASKATSKKNPKKKSTSKASKKTAKKPAGEKAVKKSKSSKKTIAKKKVKEKKPVKKKAKINKDKVHKAKNLVIEAKEVIQLSNSQNEEFKAKETELLNKLEENRQELTRARENNEDHDYIANLVIEQSKIREELLNLQFGKKTL